MVKFLRKHRVPILAVIIFGALLCSLVDVMLTCEPTKDELLFYGVVKTLQVWVHPPLANLILWPFAQLTDNIKLLRLIPVTLTMSSLLLAFLIVRRRLNPFLALLSIAPILLYRQVIAGGAFFWNEAFMLFFLMLAIYLTGRWKYVAACALVLSKLPGILFLLPLAVKDKDWKFLLPGSILAVFAVALWSVGSSPLGLFASWTYKIPIVSPYYRGYITTNWIALTTQTGIITAPILALPGIKLLWKEKWLVTAIAISLLIGAGWAFLTYQLIEFMFLSLLAISYSVERLDIYFRNRRS